MHSSLTKIQCCMHIWNHSKLKLHALSYQTKRSPKIATVFELLAKNEKICCKILTLDLKIQILLTKIETCIELCDASRLTFNVLSHETNRFPKNATVIDLLAKNVESPCKINEHTLPLSFQI